MSIDTHFYFNPARFSNSQTIEFAQRMIVEVFGEQKEEEDFKVKWIESCNGDYATITFRDDDKNKEYFRQLNIHFNTDFGGFTATLFSLYADEPAQRFMESCAREIGGFYEANDCDGIIKEFQPKMRGNETWLLKQIELGLDTDGKFKKELLSKLDEY